MKVYRRDPREAGDRRRGTAPRRGRRLAWLAAGAALGAALGPHVALPAAALLRPAALAAREVRVVGAQRVPAAEIAAAVDVEEGERLDRLDPEALAVRLLAHPWIAEARVTRHPRGRLRVTLREREPVAVARLEASGGEPAGTWWVDAEGIAFAPAGDAPAPDLPRLLDSGATPERPDALLAAGVEIATRLAERGLPAARAIHLGGAPPERLPALELGDPPARVVLGPGDLDARLAGLGALLAAELPEVRDASEIDLRFGGRAVLRSDPVPDGDREAEARGGAPPPG